MQEVIALVNAARVAAGLSEVAGDERLDKIAQGWATKMYERGVLSHGNPAQRIDSALGKAVASGECVAQGQPSAAAVVEAWLDDPPHRAIVLGPYNCVGVGHAGAYWVADFAQD